jgi:hypothetical protein
MLLVVKVCIRDNLRSVIDEIRVLSATLKFDVLNLHLKLVFTLVLYFPKKENYI